MYTYQLARGVFFFVSQVTWLMNEEVVAANERVMAFDPRYSISTPSPGKWNLVISDVKPSDKGEYRCMVDTGVKEEYTFLLTVDGQCGLPFPCHSSLLPFDV